MLYYQQGKKNQAQQWWLTAANMNDEYAQFNLASLFLEQNSFKEATYWFQRAKDNNHPQAQTALDKLKRE
jgi:TPR repeat protein